MTSRGTAQDCHIDCQVTEGCLGWFLGNVGGVKSCVLYGCGEFRKIDQQDSVSCRIGDCIGSFSHLEFKNMICFLHQMVGWKNFTPASTRTTTDILERRGGRELCKQQGEQVTFLLIICALCYSLYQYLYLGYENMSST